MSYRWHRMTRPHHPIATRSQNESDVSHDDEVGGHCAIIFFDNSDSEKDTFRSRRKTPIGVSETNPADRRVRRNPGPVPRTNPSPTRRRNPSLMRRKYATKARGSNP